VTHSVLTVTQQNNAKDQIVNRKRSALVDILEVCEFLRAFVTVSASSGKT